MTPDPNTLGSGRSQLRNGVRRGLALGLPLALLALITAPGAWAKGAAAQPFASRYAQPMSAAHEAAEALRLAVKSPGMSVAVALGPEVIWSEGLGEADAENHAPVRPETRFRVGSLSKLLTAATVARLMEVGKLDLDAPIQRYVPSFPVKDPAKPITPRLIAGHLSGIRHYLPTDPESKTYANLTEALAIFKDDPLLTPPGERYFYSSYAFNLLGVAVEGAGGGDFLSVVRRYVLDPLGLKGTTDDDPDAVLDQRARPYLRDDAGVLHNEEPSDSRFKLPSGGFVSTAPDLARFATAHAAPGFLKRETLDLLFTSQKTADGKETGVGIAWRIGKDEAGRRFYHHGGSIGGGRAMLVFYPDVPGGGLAIAILTNLSGAGFAVAETQKVVEPFLQKLAPPASPAPAGGNAPASTPKN